MLHLIYSHTCITGPVTFFPLPPFTLLQLFFFSYFSSDTFCLVLFSSYVSPLLYFLLLSFHTIIIFNGIIRDPPPPPFLLFNLPNTATGPGPSTPVALQRYHVIPAGLCFLKRLCPRCDHCGNDAKDNLLISSLYSQS